MCRASGIPVRHLLVGIAAALLYDAEGDEQVETLQRDIAVKGLENTIADITGFAPGDVEVAGVLEAYAQLKAARAQSS
jgi:mannitol-1-phosphate 5-dehydrogenase